MKSSAKAGILDQIAVAMEPKHRLALFIGSLLGGFVPIATFMLARYETQATPLKWILVAGGLLYSALTVFRWGTIAFESRYKAVGFCVLIEGVAIFASTLIVALAALACLAFINGIATTSTLIVERKLVRSSNRKVGASTKPARKTPPATASVRTRPSRALTTAAEGTA
jgi:hypothetical protein